jgi:hypothetical protein
MSDASGAVQDNSDIPSVIENQLYVGSDIDGLWTVLSFILNVRSVKNLIVSLPVYAKSG